MLYQIKDKYYIRVAPMKYTEVTFVLKDNDVIIKPTRNKIESDSETQIKEINFQKEKDNIMSDLLRKDETTVCEKKETVGTRYRKRR